MMQVTAQTMAVAMVLSSGVLSNPVGAYGAESLVFRVPAAVAYDSLHNIHVEISKDFEGHIEIVHGSCDMADIEDGHHKIGSAFVTPGSRPDRFVWTIPEDALHHGCLHGYSNGQLIARSSPIAIKEPFHKRETISEVADMSGPWFDGVAAMSGKQTTSVVSEEAKNKSIAIVGGGMSGLLTSLLLDSIGMHNWHIHEASGRIGGRIRTKYLAETKPEDYQYQEMG